MLTRTHFLLAGLALSALVTTAEAQNPPLTTVRVANGLTRPVQVVAPPGDFNRLFIVEQRIASTGQIRVLDLNTMVLSPTVYLAVPGVATGNEQGLLGLAFHPDFANNGYLYINATIGANTIVRRYTANAPFMTSTTADAASAFQIISIPQPFSNHNGGWLDFGPDGHLYIGMGDGGSANDPGNRAQNINDLLGKMLRLDVNGGSPYAIPPTNPYVGIPGADEILHIGLRNPWRNCFDRLTGDLYIGDVGQNAIEEISFSPAGATGLNYGWRCMEGNNCTGLSGCTCSSAALTPPIHTYTHGFGCSVTGGMVYRGSAICGLQGTYFFADYCTNSIWSFRYTGSANPPVTTRTAELAPGGGLAINSITSFGEDAAGEIYICDQGGEIFKIVRGPITDCNNNGTHDACDIASGTSLDNNTNGIPDECEPTVTPFCFGDGSGTPCPCGNNGAAGNGCANSVFSVGGNLQSSGLASISADSLLLLGSNMPNSSALYFQGTSQQAGGAGAAFGDGKRCAGGSVIRLGTKVNFNGQSSYPEILDPQISVRGMITSGPTTRTYQIWYRNAAAFCTPDTFNLTNGLSVTWVN